MDSKTKKGLDKINRIFDSVTSHSESRDTDLLSSSYDIESPTVLSETEEDEESRPEDIENDEEVKAVRFSLREMVTYDELVNGEIESGEKRRSFIFSMFMLVSGILLFTFLGIEDHDFCYGDDNTNSSSASSSSHDANSELDFKCYGDFQLVLNIILLSVLFVGIGIVAGLIAVKKNINVGYTRKTLHFSSFFLPFAINKIVHIEGNVLTTLLKFWLILLVYLLGTKVIRRHFKPFLLIFRAIDRPADRPYTLKWMVTQFITSSIVIIPFVYLWDKWGDEYEDLILILVLINGIGDGLAEPVGIKFGKHKYKTRALYYNGKFCSGAFTRSYEGSSVVFIVSVISIVIFYDVFTTWQLVIALAIIPIGMTLTEAFSPRTWDSPFLFLVGALLLSGIVQLPI